MQRRILRCRELRAETQEGPYHGAHTVRKYGQAVHGGYRKAGRIDGFADSECKADK